MLLNGLHEIWALLKSMGLLPLTYSEDRASSSFWQRKEDHSCVPHFKQEYLIHLEEQWEFQMKGLHLEKPKYEQKTGLTCCLPGKMSQEEVGLKPSLS